MSNGAFMIENMCSRLDKARNSREYQIYLEVREKVLDMMNIMSKNGQIPSDYWQEEVAGFDYMFDASPLIIHSLRHHCYHVTGIKPYDYRNHHARNKIKLQEKYDLLKTSDSEGLFVPESPQLGGFGFKSEDLMYNIDTLKYYESILVLYQNGYLNNFDSLGRKTVLEIGGGWGGFAYQFKTLFPNTNYIIIDLPQTLIFSATYLQAVFPNAKCMYYTKPNTVLNPDNYDFIFIPHYLLDNLSTSLDLTINTVSFQEMTKSQVDNYCSKIFSMKCPRLYSYNRYQNLNNPELGILNSIIEKYYMVDFATLTAQRPSIIKRYLKKQKVLNKFYKLYRLIKTGDASLSDYNYYHCLGSIID